jgi:hypothetical protein
MLHHTNAILHFTLKYLNHDPNFINDMVENNDGKMNRWMVKKKKMNKNVLNVYFPNELLIFCMLFQLSTK